ncbi:MAG: hypothetical protein V4719_29565, partial [Planctomycetota bacterium]
EKPHLQSGRVRKFERPTPIDQPRPSNQPREFSRPFNFFDFFARHGHLKWVLPPQTANQRRRRVSHFALFAPLREIFPASRSLKTRRFFAPFDFFSPCPRFAAPQLHAIATDPIPD